MKNIKSKKLISLVSLSIVFLLVLGSCGTDAPPPAAGEAGDTAEQAQAQAGEEQEIVVLTMMLYGQQEEGIVETYLDLAMRDAIGVVLDRINATMERVALVTAAGDLPDIIHFFNVPDIANAQIAAGTLHPLDDLLEQYGQNILNNIPTGIRWSREIIGDGTTYIIPTRSSFADTQNPNRNGWFGSYFTRWDIYQAIGMPEMNNEDDFLDVLYMMMEYQPVNQDGRRVWGLTLWTDWGLWPFNNTYANTHGYEIMVGQGAFVNRETLEIQSQFIDPDGIFWQALRFYNKAWNRGVLDPDGFTNQTDHIGEKVATGEVLSIGASWWTPNNDILGEDAIMVMLPGPFPVFDHIFPRESILGLQVSHSIAISLASDHPDRAMQVFNWINSEEGQRALYTGVRGVDWDIIDGRPQLMGQRLDDFLSGTWDPVFMQSRGIGVYFSLDVGSARMSDGFPPWIGDALEYVMLSATPAEINFATHFAGPDARIPGQAYIAMLREGRVKSFYSDDLMTVSLGDPLPDDIARIITQADQFMQANLARVIMAEDYDEFRAIRADLIDEMIRMGAETAWEAVQANVELSRERLSLFQ